MRGQDACRARLGCLACPTNLVEHSPKCVRRAGQRRRTECDDSVARQPRGDGSDRISPVQRIEALDAVDVYVDESGYDVVIVKRKRGMRMPAGWRRVGTDFDDALGLDN